jgi:hypothetical protein
MKKPNVSEIMAALPLSEVPERGPDPILCCNVCGLGSGDLTAWQEHDERDQQLAGAQFTVFIGRDHPKCIRAMKRHPRLYAEVRGNPGTFPKLCGDCKMRNGTKCAHLDLKKNGGAGMIVKHQSLFAGAIVCIRGKGCHKPIGVAFECEGRTLLAEVP